MTARNS